MTEKETKGIINKDAVNPKVDGIAISEKTETTLSPYDIFERCIKRAGNLVCLQNLTKEVENVSDQHYNDCYRAAIVLSISALDAFIRTIILSSLRALSAAPPSALPSRGPLVFRLLLANPPQIAGNSPAELLSAAAYGAASAGKTP